MDKDVISASDVTDNSCDCVVCWRVKKKLETVEWIINRAV